MPADFPAFAEATAGEPARTIGGRMASLTMTPDLSALTGAAKAVYNRVVLKLSGESLQGPDDSGIHAETVVRIAKELKEVADMGAQIAIMVGGGNIFRGTRQKSLAIDRATGDYMGMLATVINGLALQDALEKQGAHTRLMRRSRCTRWPSRSYGGARCVTWKKGAW